MWDPREQQQQQSCIRATQRQFSLWNRDEAILRVQQLHRETKETSGHSSTSSSSFIPGWWFWGRRMKVKLHVTFSKHLFHFTTVADGTAFSRWKRAGGEEGRGERKVLTLSSLAITFGEKPPLSFYCLHTRYLYFFTVGLQTAWVGFWTEEMAQGKVLERHNLLKKMNAKENIRTALKQMSCFSSLRILLLDYCSKPRILVWVRIQLCVRKLCTCYGKEIIANRLGNSEDKICLERRSRYKKLGNPSRKWWIYIMCTHSTCC